MLRHTFRTNHRPTPQTFKNSFIRNFSYRIELSFLSRQIRNFVFPKFSPTSPNTTSRFTTRSKKKEETLSENVQFSRDRNRTKKMIAPKFSRLTDRKKFLTLLPSKSFRSSAGWFSTRYPSLVTRERALREEEIGHCGR